MSSPFYLPVMPVLPGDMEGIRHASREAQKITRPLFVIMKPRQRKSDSSENFVVRAADAIARAWRLKSSPFIELYDIPTNDSNDWWPTDHALILLHRYLRNNGILGIPVITTDRTGDYYDAFVRCSKANSVGVAVRLYEEDFEVPNKTVVKLGAIAKDIECTNAAIDVIIDLKRVFLQKLPVLKSQILDLLAAFDHQERFRSVTLVGSSVPQTLYGIPHNEDRDVPRLELRLWRELRAARPAPFEVGLGDYGVVRPEYDDRAKGFSHINGKILYTTLDSIRVLRGQSRQKEKLEFQYPKLAARLSSSKVFFGAEFSWGDGQIAQCASHAEGFGQPVTWISVATSHHIEVACLQTMREIAVPA